jgi:hypothetical protein
LGGRDRRTVVQSQPRQIVPQDLISKNPSQKIGLVDWLKVKAPSSSPSISKIKKHNTETKVCQCMLVRPCL